MALADRCEYVYVSGKKQGTQCRSAAKLHGLCGRHLELPGRRKTRGELMEEAADRIVSAAELDDAIDSQDTRTRKERVDSAERAARAEERRQLRIQAGKTVATDIVLHQTGVDTVRLLESGFVKVEDLSWDELVGGFVYLRDPLTGEITDKREPKYLPRNFHQQVTRALFAQADQLFRDEFDAAMSALADLVRNPHTPARERLAAAQYIIERVIGKIPEKQEVEVSVSPFQSMVESAELVVDLEDVEDAEIVD